MAPTGIPIRSQKASKAKKVNAKNNPFPMSKSHRSGHRRQRAPYVVGGATVHDKTMKSRLVQDVIDFGQTSARFGEHLDQPLDSQSDRTRRGKGRPLIQTEISPPVEWPHDVAQLTASTNPESVQFPDLGDLRRCERKHRCARLRCLSAASNTICRDDNCNADADYGNRPVQLGCLELCKSDLGFHLRAKKMVNAGCIVCPYFGKLTQATRGAGGQQREYALKLRMRMIEKKAVFIDPEAADGYGRFTNHSCEPKCVFAELRCCDKVEVALVAITCINVGEEITVDNGDELWFDCKCGSAKCRSI